MKIINNEQFAEFVSSGRKAIQFSANWCGPCKVLTKTIENIETDKVEFAKVDIDGSRDLALEFNIRAVPVVILFEDGKESKRFIGNKSQNDILQFIE